jgi:carbon monoxide dehydrogenase subunit G
MFGRLGAGWRLDRSRLKSNGGQTDFESRLLFKTAYLCKLLTSGFETAEPDNGMDLGGEYLIAAKRKKVWKALNDPNVLRECIPGCESLEMTTPTHMTATVVTKIGPVKARFSGEVKLTNIKAQESYTISGEGKGGIAGFAKGGADVRLEDADAGTRLVYVAKAQVGGKLAQLGSRLIDSTAKKLADQFFRNFAEKLGG